MNAQGNTGYSKFSTAFLIAPIASASKCASRSVFAVAFHASTSTCVSTARTQPPRLEAPAPLLLLDGHAREGAAPTRAAAFLA